jgi:hypothetical protein
MPPSGVGDLDLDLLVVELAARSFLAEGIARAGLAVAPTSASSTRSSALTWALALTSSRRLLAHQADRDLDEIADDLLRRRGRHSRPR